MYATATELTKAVGFQFQAIFADYTEEEQTTELERVLTEASDTIDALIRNRVTLPLTGENALLKRLCLSLARYDIFSAMVRDQVPEAVRLDKEDAMKTLEKISQGKLIIDDGSENADAMIEPEFTSATQVFDTFMD